MLRIFSTQQVMFNILLSTPLCNRNELRWHNAVISVNIQAINIHLILISLECRKHKNNFEKNKIILIKDVMGPYDAGV